MVCHCSALTTLTCHTQKDKYPAFVQRNDTCNKFLQIQGYVTDHISKAFELSSKVFIV